jgi:hypothetical protein
VLQRLNTPRGNSVDSQQSNNPSAPQPSYKDRVLNINNTNIILDKLGTDTDDTAKFKRIASEVNKQYT